MMGVDSRGFSIIEVAMVLMIAAALLDMALSAAAPVSNRLSVSSSRSALVALHARARAHAVERGVMTRLHVDPEGDSAWVSDAGERIETVDFYETWGVDLIAAAPIELCMSPRGHADRDCNSFGSTVDVEFSRGGLSAVVMIRPLGQLVIR